MGTARIRETARWESSLDPHDQTDVEGEGESLGTAQAVSWFAWLVAGAAIWTGLIVLLLYLL